MKYGLTKKEEKLYARALYYQNQADECVSAFKNSLINRFPNSCIVYDYENYDLWTLNPSGDLSNDENALKDFWNDVREELKR